MSTEFLITSLILVITPGPGVLYTLTAGISRGQRASVIAAIGCTLGIVPHLAAAIFGVAALLYASAMAFQALKILGVIYLLYMAWVTIRDQSGFTIETVDDGRSDREVIQSAILVNALNPKLAIFFFAFLPQFVHADDPQFFTRMLGTQRRLHGADAGGVCDLRVARRRSAPADHFAAACGGLDAAQLRGGIRRAGCASWR